MDEPLFSLIPTVLLGAIRRRVLSTPTRRRSCGRGTLVVVGTEGRAREARVARVSRVSGGRADPLVRVVVAGLNGSVNTLSVFLESKN